MPDHWHALIGIYNNQSLSKALRVINGWIGKEIKSILESNGCKWQDGYYETRIRSSKQFLYIKNYIETNPIASRLVTDKCEWQWSSTNFEYDQFLTKYWPWRFEKDYE